MMVEYFCQTNITTELEKNITCMDGHNHDYLLPYFYANSSLQDKLHEIIQTTTDRTHKTLADETLKNLQDVLNANYQVNTLPEECQPFTYCFYPDIYVNDYDENVWSCRLFYSLKLFHHDFSSEYTAADQIGIQSLHQILATYPDVPIYAYIFRGAPDITVSRNPVIIGASEEDNESTDGDIAQVEHCLSDEPIK